MSDHKMEKEERAPSVPPMRPMTTALPPTDDSGNPKITILDERCFSNGTDYQEAICTMCAMLLVFGIVYSLFGYRCFKAVMFLTGMLFGTVVVYLICLEENLLPDFGNEGVAIGAGVLFGLITMLVQYVGLFMTGFHTGVLIGIIVVTVLDHFNRPSTIWITVGILIGCGLLFAVLTLQWQKGLTIIGTSIYGGAVMAASLDYFIEKAIMVNWIWDKVKITNSDTPCWFSWIILAVWPFMIIVGSATQFGITGKEIYHQDILPSKKFRQQANVQRLRNRTSRETIKQRRYRYLYQVRTARGDVLSQSYIQSLQAKASPFGEGSGDGGDGGTQTTRSDLTQLSSTFSAPPNYSANTTLSRVP
ncbi:hypothetical protein CHUAL_013072 [Chamberlinius hualienensis]